MHEISPVLSGKYDDPGYTPASANLTVGGTPASTNAALTGGAYAASPTSDTSSVSQVDSRRYTKFDRTASNAGEMKNFTFGDFLDAINPLEHIPVASSVYRDAENETINPVSRVVGDMMYGGIFGVASVVLGGLSAVADAAMESETGKDTTGTVLAELFGDEKTKAGDDTVQVAQNTQAPASAPVTQVASAQTQTQSQTQAPKSQSGSPSPAAATTQMAAASGSGAPSSTSNNTANGTAPSSGPTQFAKMFPVNTKLPYGGVMAPPGANQDQNTMMALSQNPRAMRIGNTILTGRLANGPLPMAASANVASAAPPAPTPSSPGTTPSANTANAAPSTPMPTLSNSSLAALLSASGNAMPGSFMSKPNDPMAALSAGGDPNMPNALPPDLMNNAIMLKALSQYNNVAGSAYTPTPKSDLND